jgi:hypothetical protein
MESWLTPAALLEPVMATIKAGQPIFLKRNTDMVSKIYSKSCHELVGQL